MLEMTVGGGLPSAGHRGKEPKTSSLHTEGYAVPRGLFPLPAEGIQVSLKTNYPAPPWSCER